MPKRITNAQLELRIARLNSIMGYAHEPYHTDENGKFAVHPDVYHLESSNGGFALVQNLSTGKGSGENLVIGRGSKRELFEKLGAYIEGANAVFKRFNGG